MEEQIITPIEENNPKSRISKWWWVAITVFAVGILALLGWWIFRVRPESIKPNLTVWVDKAESVRSGSATDITIVYESQESKELQDLKLEIAYPNGFQFLRSDSASENDLGRNFNLDNLPANGSGKVKITGIFTGSPNEVKTVRATIYYKVKNISAIFSTKAEAQIALLAPNITLTIDAPVQSIIGQRIDYLIKYKNVSDQALEQAEIRPLFPFGFTFLDASVAAAKDNIWKLGRLEVGAEGQLRISGVLSGQAGDERTMNITLGYEDEQGDFVLQNQAFITTRLQPPPLSVTLSESNDLKAADEGQTFAFSVNYDNQSSQALQRVRVVLSFEGEALELSSLRAEGGALVGKDLVWNAVGRPGLLLIQPGQKGELSASGRIRSDLFAKNVKNPFLTAKVFFSSDELPQLVQSGEWQIRVRTEITFVPQLQYVSGPNPPRVGQETVYKVSWQIQNAVNDLSGIIANAQINIPAAVMVDDSVSPASWKDKIRYIASSGQIIWSAGDLPAFGTHQVEFLVKVTPSLTDQKRNLLVIKNFSISGTDTFTEEKLEIKPTIKLETSDISP